MKITVYLHADKEALYEHGKEAGLEGEALKYFLHACSDVEVLLEVDAAGSAEIIAVDGKKLTMEE